MPRQTFLEVIGKLLPNLSSIVDEVWFKWIDTDE